MDVVNTWTKFIRISELSEGVQQLEIGPRGLYGDDICFEIGNRLDDVVELAVTHVAVNLGLILHTTAG